MSDISYVFPYVNDSDPNWVEKYKKWFPNDEKKKYPKQRARELGTLKYVFRGLAENLPWLKEVVLLVDFPSQVPDWLNIENNLVRVVTLDEFIPKKFLPTFNSCTIEMFLPRIPGINKFIYGNDDFVPSNPSLPEDYFSDAGAPIFDMKFRNSYIKNFSHDIQCKNTYDLVSNKLGIVNIDKKIFYEKNHIPYPITMNIANECAGLFSSEMINSITLTRRLKINLAQDIYFVYAWLAKRCLRGSSIRGCVAHITDTDIDTTINKINSSEYHWICLNDISGTSLNKVPRVLEALQYKFPYKSKYEK